MFWVIIIKYSLKVPSNYKGVINVGLHQALETKSNHSESALLVYRHAIAWVMKLFDQESNDQTY